ncbi:Csu type fimbrial protein [Roseicella frigidaeris]|nr:spore coat U domain-containing protein [Roseicella frigidaeris]
MRRIACLILPAFAALLGGPPAAAQVCTVSTAGTAFGVYDPFAAAPTDSVGSVTVQCQAAVAIGISYSVALGPGGSGNGAARLLRSGDSSLGYQLYSDAARTQVWGDGTGGGRAVSGLLLLTLGRLSLLNSLPVYGRIAARQNVAAGSYVDTIQVLLTY